MADLQRQVSAAESQLNSRVEEVAALDKQLQGLQQDLSKTTAQLAEREAKVGCICPGCAASFVCAQQHALRHLQSCIHRRSASCGSGKVYNIA